MPRFVVLEHDHPELHYDLLFEVGEVLWAWRLAGPPAAEAVRAERSFDHRVMYLDYEGPVSGGRGAVRRWAWGEYEWRERGEGRLVAEVRGARLSGALVLQAGGDGWRVALEAG